MQMKSSFYLNLVTNIWSKSGASYIEKKNRCFWYMFFAMIVEKYS